MILSIEIGSLIMNTSSSGYGLVEESGLTLPPIRNASFNLAGVNYGSHVSSFYGVRRFSLDFVVIGSTIADYRSKRDALLSAFSTLNGPQTITFNLSGGRALTLTAVTLSLDFPLKAGVPAAGDCHIEMEAAFPFFLNEELTTVVASLPTLGGGTVPAPTMPMALSMGSGVTTTAINNGTTQAYPTFRFSGPVTNPAIKNQTTGEEMRFLLSLGAGEYLDVNTLQKSIVDASGTNRYSSKTGDWWTLAPGTNLLSFRADSSDPAAIAIITYADTYLGI